MLAAGALCNVASVYNKQELEAIRRSRPAPRGDQMPRLLLVIASAVLLSTLSACVGIFTVGGEVTGLAGTGLVLQNNGGNNLAISSNGAFTFRTLLRSGETYAVTVLTQPANPAQTCTVSNGSGKVTSMKISDVTVNCVSTAYTIGGAVTGLAGTGLVLQNNGGDDLPIANDGPFTFATPVGTGASYAVTVLTQPSQPTQNCQVTNGSDTVGSVNVTGIAVTCATTMTFSGVAAVGSPLAGSVSVKDALGEVRSTPLSELGEYLIDVSGMTPPFVFRAEGRANGYTYSVHSAATQADIGGTINITQLTDLVVDNIAGQLASDYYNNGNFSSLTPAALDAEVAILKARLLPVLLALGVDPSIDLLRSRFTALSSALDTALDIVRITLDTATNIATITNIVTQQSILDDITVPAASEPNPPVLTDPSNLASVAADIDAIRQALVDFSALFATGLPSVASVEAAFTETFLSDDKDRATVAADLASDSTSIGFSFADVQINSIDYDDPTQPIANIDFTVMGANDIEQDHVTDWQIVRGSDGIWRFLGNQHVIDIGATAFAHRSMSSGCTTTGLSIGIGDVNSTNNGGAIDHILVFGPGLPATGLRYEPTPFGWMNTSQNSPGYVMANSCLPSQPLSDAAIAAIPDDARYLFVAFSSSDNSTRLDFPSGAIPSGPAAGTYSTTVEKRPLTLAEVVASTSFAIFTAPTAAAFTAYTSGPLTITATRLNPDFYAYAQVHLITASGTSRSVGSWQPPTSSGTLTTTVSLTPSAPGDAVTFRSLHVDTSDEFRRQFRTNL
jgi:hypothetical protein